MTDDMKVKIVMFAYVKTIRFVKDSFVRVKEPKTGKARENCVLFYGASEYMKVGVYPMMLVGLEQYSSGWLEQTFGREYPPFNLITSQKCLAWIRKQMPEHVHYGNIETVADAVMKTLKSVDRTTATEMIESGMICGNNEALKKNLLERLKWATATVIR